MKGVDPRRLVFLDESGANLAMGRSHAWALPGEEYVEPRPMNWGDNLSLTGAVRLDGWVTLGTQWKAVRARDFVAWVRDRLAPRLRPGDIVLLDNLRDHKAPAVAELIARRGATLKFLPPYSHDFNAIEAVWALVCCGLLKTEALTKTLSGEWPRYRFNVATKTYEVDPNIEPFTGIIAGVRADEEGSRSKERYFSPRNTENTWDVADQPPEFWNPYKTEFAPGTHVRIHPLLDWTELNIWEYIEQEKIPTVSLYYNQGDGKRYRSLGCCPCTNPVESEARTPHDIIDELRTGRFANIADCSGRAQDSEDGGGLEALRRGGYM